MIQYVLLRENCYDAILLGGGAEGGGRGDGGRREEDAEGAGVGPADGRAGAALTRELLLYYMDTGTIITTLIITSIIVYYSILYYNWCYFTSLDTRCCRSCSGFACSRPTARSGAPRPRRASGRTVRNGSLAHGGEANNKTSYKYYKFRNPF